jgi:hypothetical protein
VCLWFSQRFRVRRLEMIGIDFRLSAGASTSNRGQTCQTDYYFHHPCSFHLQHPLSPQLQFCCRWEPACSHTGSSALQTVQKSDQLRFFFYGQIHPEALIVEVHHFVEVWGRTVVSRWNGSNFASGWAVVLAGSGCWNAAL